MVDTTVHFVTNRPRGAASAAPADAFGGEFPAAAGSAAHPLFFGTARVTGTDARPGSLATGNLAEILDVQEGDFSPGARSDLLGGARNLLLFVHAFANSFSDAILRGAFNREWLAGSGRAEADCAVVVFTWPSPGRFVDGKDIIPGAASVLLTILAWALDGRVSSPFANRYVEDRTSARNSGADLARAITQMVPLLQGARQRGGRTYLLAHSMGHVVLEGAMPALPPIPGGYFDHAVLAAGDSAFANGAHPPGWLLGMPRHAAGTSVYFSDEDQILRLSEEVNGMQRLGKDGPLGRGDNRTFPQAAFRFVDCSRVQDPVPDLELDKTHQYYRRIPAVRDDIAAALAGAAPGGTTSL
jgi:esterase/lipase superfamily enzyme